MVVGIKAFREVRIVSEAGTPGVKVDTATQRLLGTLSVPMSGPILHRPMDERGSLFANRRSVIIGEEIPMTFEGDLLTDQLAYFGQMGILKITTPVNIPPYRWQFMPVSGGTSSQEILSYTFQFGDNLVAHDVSYVTAREIQLSGVMDEPCKVRATLFGRDFEVGTLLPSQGDTSIDPHSTEICLTNKTTLHIDASGGAWGTTEKASTLIDFTWTLDTGFRPLKVGSANLFFDSIYQTYPKIVCEITAVWNTAMEAERVFYQAGTRRLFAIKMDSAGGIDYCHVYFAGIYTKFDTIGEQDGIAIVRCTIESEYDSGAVALFSMAIQNSIATMV